jgi:acyl transferase domain-containing protein
MLKEGRDGKGKVPDCRYNVDGFYHPKKSRPDSVNFKEAHMLGGDPNDFDPSVFGISYAEATRMDPHQRKLLEVAFECFENAGIPLEQVSGSRTGCYIGNMALEYVYKRSPALANAYDSTGIAHSILSNRVSYAFNLKGPR